MPWIKFIRRWTPASTLYLHFCVKYLELCTKMWYFTPMGSDRCRLSWTKSRKISFKKIKKKNVLWNRLSSASHRTSSLALAITVTQLCCNISIFWALKYHTSNNRFRNVSLHAIRIDRAHESSALTTYKRNYNPKHKQPQTFSENYVWNEGQNRTVCKHIIISVCHCDIMAWPKSTSRLHHR